MGDNVAQTLLVLTNLPSQEAAAGLAKVLVEKRLAACVNVIDGCTSVYRWQDAIQIEREIPLLIKTRVERYAEVEQQILELHPYELPEIIAVPLRAGFEPYLAWLADGVVDAN